MDGDHRLRRVSPKTWAGTLHGYRVEVFRLADMWHGAVMHPKPREYTMVILPGITLAEAASKVRAWIEANSPITR